MNAAGSRSIAVATACDRRNKDSNSMRNSHSMRRLPAIRALKRAVAALACLLAIAGCATLPDTQALIERHAGQTARFENARGPLSRQKSAAILDDLKRKSGDLDILDKQIALEQAIVDSPLTVGNKVTLLQNGEATYAAMFAAIRAARDHINLESYIIEDDEVGREFATVLLEQQQRGVQVNLIYDSVGGFGTPKAYFENLTQGGIAVLEFNPVNPLAAKGPWLINNRDHRKLLVVDGRIAFLGGINISSVYASGSAVRRNGKTAENAIAWRDTHMQIEGPVVGELQKMFMETWEKQRGGPLAQKDYFPALSAQGSEIVRAIGSTPDDPYSQMYLTLVSAIGNAEKEISITQAYFVPDPQFLKSLTDAAGRGVDVRLILPSHSDSAVVFHAGRSHYSRLLEGGVKLYERLGALLHSKTAVIDGVWSTVGSTNLDWRSFLDNDEINAVIIGRDFGRKMQAMFAADMKSSESIDLASWSRRSPVLRLKEWMSRLWERLL
jgi:cardiolipin synthase